jgi:hypothetical protein
MGEPTREIGPSPDEASRIVGTLSREQQKGIIETMPIHTMPEVTKWLANSEDTDARPNIYTTTEPRDPGEFIDFRKEKKTAKELQQLAKNTRDAFTNVPGFKDAGLDLGPQLSNVFRAVTAVSVENASFAVDPKRKDSGIAVAEKIVYTVNGKDNAVLMNRALQALLRSEALTDAYPVDIDKTDDPDKFLITVHNMNEYTNRVLGNAVAQLVAEKDKDGDGNGENGTILPPDKTGHEKWKKRGETFRPEIEDRLTKLNDEYKALELHSTYKDNPTMQAAKDDYLLGTDPAAMFQVVRDAFRPLINANRPGGSASNLEQNPQDSSHLLIERNVTLTREKANDPSADPQAKPAGPAAPSAYSTGQELKARAKSRLRDVMQDKARAGIELVTAVIGSGIETAVGGAMKGALTATRYSGEVKNDMDEWKDQKAKFEHSRARIAEVLLNDLLSEDNGN